MAGQGAAARRAESAPVTSSALAGHRDLHERCERAGHRAHVEASADELMDRWADVLIRLGSV